MDQPNPQPTNAQPTVTKDIELPPDQSLRIVSDKTLNTFLLLSVSDEPIFVGKGSNRYDDFSPYSRVHIFAESLSFSGDLPSPHGISISCNDIFLVDTTKIDATGLPGADQVIGNSASKAEVGTGGGSINLYTQNGSDDVAKYLLSVVNGGKGGDVVVEDAQAADGGVGGSSLRIFQSRYSTLLDSIKTFLDRFEKSPLDSLVRPKDSIYLEAIQLLAATDELALTEKDAVERIEALRTELTGIKAGTKSKANDIVICVRFVRNRVEDLADRQKGNFGAAALYKGGYPGSGKKVPGKTGAYGNDGSDAPLFLSSYDPVAIRKTSFAFAHPEQCAMLLDRAKIFYYMGSSDLRLQAKRLFRRLVQRLSFLPLLKDDPLYQAYTDKNSIMPSGSYSKLLAIKTEAVNWLTQLAAGVGFNGHTDNWTPRASYTFYDGMMQNAIDDYTAFEDAYIQYHAALSANKKLRVSIGLALTQTSKMIGRLEEDIKDLADRLRDTDNSIASLSDPVTTTHNALDIVFKEFKDRIKNDFDLSVPQLVNALRSLAFSPTKGMAGLEGANLVYEGITSVPNVDGQPVKKDLIIRKIKHGEATVKSIKDKLDKSLDGTFTLDDPSGTRLMTTEEDMMSFLEDYANSSFANVIDQMKEKFDAFVKAIIARNQQVVLYNIQLKLYLSKIAEKETYNSKKDDLKGKDIDSSNPNLPSITAYMGDIYQSSRARVMQLLDYLIRSLNFRGLTRHDIFTLAFEGTNSKKAPLTMTSNVLLSGWSRTTREFGKVVEKWAGPPVPFPPNFDDDHGKRIHLKKKEWKALIKDHKLIIEIPVMKKETITKSPFSGGCDVRIYRARFGFTGLAAKADDAFVCISIKHSGEEIIMDLKNSEHTFVHEPVKTQFSFYLDLDGKTHVQNNGKISGVDVNETVKYYAAPGPFTKWEIDMTASKMTSLDFTNVSDAYIDFCGTNHVFP